MKKPRNRLVAILREPVTVAIFTAVLVTSVLAFAVFAIWTGAPNAGGPQAGPSSQLGALTPTPRAINWPGAAPAASPPLTTPGPSVAPNSANVPSINAVAANSPTPQPTVAAPQPTAPEPTAASSPTEAPAPTDVPPPTATPALPPTMPPSPTPEPEFAASDAASFASLATWPWSTSGDALVYESPQALAEPWLLAPYQTPSGDFAIEAEIRVDGLAQGVCNQSFGVVAGSESTGQFWGGGVIYACGSNNPAARITDVSNWTNGYDQDRQLARGNFDPDDEWHHYRLEVRGNEFRLLIDGAEVLTAAESALPGGLSSGQAGLWTQGVQLTVRSLAIFAL